MIEEDGPRDPLRSELEVCVVRIGAITGGSTSDKVQCDNSRGEFGATRYGDATQWLQTPVRTAATGPPRIDWRSELLPGGPSWTVDSPPGRRAIPLARQEVGQVRAAGTRSMRSSPQRPVTSGAVNHFTASDAPTGDAEVEPLQAVDHGGE